LLVDWFGILLNFLWTAVFYLCWLVKLFCWCIYCLFVHGPVSLWLSCAWHCLLCSVDCFVDMGAPWYTGTSQYQWGEVAPHLFLFRLLVDALSWYQHWYWLLVYFLLYCLVWYVNDLNCTCLCVVTGTSPCLTCTPLSLLLIACLT
jgi:hypothetical protein